EFGVDLPLFVGVLQLVGRNVLRLGSAARGRGNGQETDDEAVRIAGEGDTENLRRSWRRRAGSRRTAQRPPIPCTRRTTPRPTRRAGPEQEKAKQCDGQGSRPVHQSLRSCEAPARLPKNYARPFGPTGKASSKCSMPEKLA